MANPQLLNGFGGISLNKSRGKAIRKGGKGLLGISIEFQEVVYAVKVIDKRNRPLQGVQILATDTTIPIAYAATTAANGIALILGVGYTELLIVKNSVRIDLDGLTPTTLFTYVLEPPPLDLN